MRHRQRLKTSNIAADSEILIREPGSQEAVKSLRALDHRPMTRIWKKNQIRGSDLFAELSGILASCQAVPGAGYYQRRSLITPNSFCYFIKPEPKSHYCSRQRARATA